MQLKPRRELSVATVGVCLLSMACGNPPAPPSSGPATTTTASATDRSPEALTRRTVQRRAVQAVIWGMPAVNTDLMRQEMFRKTAGKENEVLYWSRPADANNQTL